LMKQVEEAIADGSDMSLAIVVEGDALLKM
jgi:hypothetical protein